MTHSLMEYLPPVQQPQAPQRAERETRQGGAGKYHGRVAEGYDAKRINDPKWAIEQRVIEGMLSDMPAGTVVLDCPVGTGRFLDFYTAKGFTFIGADLSGDMLVQSALKIAADQAQVEAWVAACNKANVIMPLQVKGRGSLVNGDIRQIGLQDKSVDVGVMVRLTRWLSPEDCQVAMRQLQRVCRQRIIWTARVANHRHARTVELFEAALDRWKITRNEAGVVLDYRILMAEPT